MRISDWSSDVCSSDLTRCARGSPGCSTSHSIRSASRLPPPSGWASPAVKKASPHKRSQPSDYQRIAYEVPYRSERARADRHQQRGRRRDPVRRSEEHTSELQSLMLITYAVFCLNKTE